VVLRILRKDRALIALEELGFSTEHMKLIDEAIKHPNGVILVTGPTGSGKSTTLYALIKKLINGTRKIITLEDPIEYHVDGVEQTQINPEQGYTFSNGLRGILRQDPDVVLLGEVRDSETASTALAAGRSGHLVLSTLHSTTAIDAYIRFLEMGIAPYQLTGSIRLIITQRLVRKIVGKNPDGSPIYKGRVVVAEVLAPSKSFEHAVALQTDPVTLEEIAKKDGYLPMTIDAAAKVANGLTSEEEVERVVVDV
jgi:general secretion pathway protein E